MPQVSRGVIAILVLLLSPVATLAQSPQESSTAVPRLITITGVFRPADGQPPNAAESVTLSIYADQAGGSPIWQETQSVTLDDRGRYSLQLGATHADGIPAAVFASGAQWLGTVFERRGEVEGPRVRLTSVPYALRAADADTLGGRPASDYVVAPNSGGDARAAGTTSGAQSADVSSPSAVLGGTPNFLAKYVNAADVGDSAVYESGGMVGVGTTTPFDFFHVKYTNTTGAFTGLAVQNMGNTATSYSGMLFYDQNNQLGQFQGFNNVTHEYRINNIANNGSINFMLGGTSKFLVAPNGGIGIGTTTPGPGLSVSNALTGALVGSIGVSTFGNNPFGGTYVASKARGTQAAPAAVQNGDQIALFAGVGQATTHSGNLGNGMTVSAAENYTDAAQGTALNFFTTKRGTNQPFAAMTLDATGFLGIGTSSPVSSLEVSNAQSGSAATQVNATTFANSGAASVFLGSKARGTSAAPAAVQLNDNLAAFLGRGFGATTFSSTRGGMFVTASENWTDTAQGTRLNFNTTTNGTIAPTPRMTIDNVGNVGIGTTNPITTLEIVRNGETNFIGTSYNDDDGSAVFFQRARGTLQAPASVLAGDALGYFGAGGRGATTWGEGVGVMAVVAAENWTDTANGTTVAFANTPLGTTDFVPQAAILPNGFLGLGTPGDVNGIPTATDRLQVFGDIRIGTTGTNGCLKRFDGTALAGTCSSDRRFKKDITPFAPVLNQLTALQPVRYYWRSEDFPSRHFGNSRAYGLIAQDVEQVLPELVATDGDGYKAVDYSELPLLTIQAVKELKAENDALKTRVADLEELKTENVALKQRLTEIEKLLTQVLGNSARR